MLYYLAPHLERFWGPFRLLRSHVLLIAAGTLLAALAVKPLNNLLEASLLDRQKELVEKLEKLSNVYFSSRVKHIRTMPDTAPQNKQLFLNIETIDEAITNGKQIARICKLSGTYLPSRFKAIVDKFGDKPDAMLDAGVTYATEQIIDLFANGINAVHIYTMNKPEVAERIMANLSGILSDDDR